MKIKSVEIKEDRVLKNIGISFENNGNILNTIVIAGANGSGKTTLLESIIKNIEECLGKYIQRPDENRVNFYFEDNENRIIERERVNLKEKWPITYSSNNLFFNYLKLQETRKSHQLISSVSENIYPKVIYVPSEIKFEKSEVNTTSLKVDYKLINIVNNELIKSIPSYIASRITYVANTEEDLTMKQVREKVSEEINRIFDILDIDVKLKGVSKDETSTPIFTNSSGDEFDINGLSSGEKQLFLRTLAIKMLEPENSIILIDEPELSLHPKWQSKIIKVYERIGKNNQIIIATHSPHILGSVPKENIIILSKDNEGKVFPMTGDKLYSSYGQPVDRILEDIMGMETTRNQDVFNILEKTRELVREDKYDTQEFKDNYQKLINILGTTDKDLLLINMEVQRRKRGIKNV